jgi:hypothetical protein
VAEKEGCMKLHLSPKTLLTIAGVKLLVITGIMASWLTPLVLNPARTADIVASDQSTLSEPRAFFRMPGLTGSVGEFTRVQVLLDGATVSESILSADLRYLPVEAEVLLDTSAPTMCSAYTAQDHNPVSGQFKLRCTAPSGTRATQDKPFATFLVKPLRPGGMSLELVGRTRDYAVINAK